MIKKEMKRFNEYLGLEEYDYEMGSKIGRILEKKDMYITVVYSFSSGLIRYKIIQGDNMICRELKNESGFITYEKILEDVKNFLVNSVPLSCEFVK